MKDVILTLGCSYTDPNFKSKNRLLEDAPPSVVGGWPMWPQIFTEKLSERDQVQYKLINAGLSGSGMDYQAEMFFEHWLEYKDSLKIVLWGGTSYFRFQHFSNGRKVAIQHYQDGRKERKLAYPSYEKVTEKIAEYGCTEYLKNLAKQTGGDELYLRRAKVNHEMIVAIRDLCELNGTHFIFYPLINPFSGGTYKKVGGRTRRITQQETMNYFYQGSPKAWESIMKDRNFIGITSHGFEWINWLLLTKNDENCQIQHSKEYPNNDSHPNDRGQRLIANEFWKHYEKHF